MLSLLFIFRIGETILILIALLFVVALPFILIGIVFFILRKNSKNRTVWREISQKLNLEMANPKKLELKGNYRGTEVKAAVGARRSGSGEDSHTEFFTYAESSFPHPFRLLLNISSPKGLFSNIFKSNQMTLGQANFDQQFNVKCYDQNVLRQLLLTEFHSDKTHNLMGDLMLARQSFATINVTDKKIYLETGGQVDDPEVLKNLLDLTTYLKMRFQTMRGKLPPAVWEKQLLANWQTLASENNLAFDPKLMQMQGVYKNFPIFVELDTDRDNWKTKIRMKFPASLMIGLKIMPENSLHKALTWFGMQDIESGRKDFDDAFIVKGKNVQIARHKLQPDLCNQLVGLNSNASHISVTDEEMAVTFEQILGDKRVLQSYLEAIVTTARMLIR